MTTTEPIISDSTATLVLQMAKKFYSDPNNQKMFDEWYFKRHGYYPNEIRK